MAAVPDKLIKMIQDIGYRALVGDGLIKTAMSKYSILVFYFESSIQMYFGVINEDSFFHLDDANDFNRKYRFVKCYLRDQEAICFEQDFAFDLNSPDAKSRLERVFDSWEVTIGSADSAIEEARQKRASETS